MVWALLSAMRRVGVAAAAIDGRRWTNNGLRLQRGDAEEKPQKLTGPQQKSAPAVKLPPGAGA